MNLYQSFSSATTITHTIDSHIVMRLFAGIGLNTCFHTIYKEIG
jgi:hypothetical protein